MVTWCKEISYVLLAAFQAAIAAVAAAAPMVSQIVRISLQISGAAGGW